MTMASIRSNRDAHLVGGNRGDAMARPLPEKRPTALSFVVISDPAQTKSPAARRLVRSQAARESQSSNRRPRKLRQLVVGNGSSGPAKTERAQAPAKFGNRKALDQVCTARAEDAPDVQKLLYGGSESPQSECGAHFASKVELLKKDRRGGIIPSPLTLLTPGRDPFNAFVRKVSVFEEFLLNHYITIALPHHFCPYGEWNLVDRAEYRLRMAKEWVAFLLTDAALMCALLLAGSRTLAQFYDDDAERSTFYERVALHYKGQVLRATSESIKEEGDEVSDATIVKSLALAFDDSLVDDFSSLRRHILAIRRMVEMRGGREKLGMNGFLELTVRTFVEPDQLVSIET